VARRRKDIPVGPPTRPKRTPEPASGAASQAPAFSEAASPPASLAPSRARARRVPARATAVRAPGRWDLVVVLLLTLAGFGLRFATIDARGLWLDEATTVFQTAGTLLQTIQSQIGGTHPPFFHVLMHIWIYYFGDSEVAIRLFATVFGILAIPAAYWAGRQVYDRRVGLIAAALLAVSPFQIWYSQEARMYTMLMLFALLSVGAFSRALEKNSLGSWVSYFVFSLMGAFTQYLFLLLVIGQGLYFVLFEVVDREIWLTRAGRREASFSNPLGITKDVPTLVPYLVCMAVLAIPVFIWLNWAVFFPPNQDAALVGAVTNSGLGYAAPKPGLAIRFNDVLETIVELIFGSQSPTVAFGLVAMWPLLVYFTMLVMGGGRYITRKTTLMLCSASGALVVWGLGQWQGVVLLSRYLTPMAAPAVILLASVLSRMADRGRRIALAVVIAVCLGAYVAQSLAPDSTLRYQNREVIQYVVAHQQPGDLIIYEPFYTDVLVNYYLPSNVVAYGFPRFDANGHFRDSEADIEQDLARIVGRTKRVWIIRAFQNVPAIGYQAYLTDRWFLSHGYVKSGRDVLNKAEWVQFTSTIPVPDTTQPAGAAPTEGSLTAPPTPRATGGGAP
jgi:mannosyltransferase